MKRTHSEDHDIPPADLGERLSNLRLRDAAALENMRQSLDHHGQLEPLVAFQCQDKLEVIDGFKRVIAARALNWSSLRVRLVDVDIVEAKCMLIALHDRRGITELEEGWLIRSLYRDDNLSSNSAKKVGRDVQSACEARAARRIRSDRASSSTRRARMTAPTMVAVRRRASSLRALGARPG